MKIKLYKVNRYNAFGEEEVCVEWHTHKPVDSVFYKYEILEEVEIELPEGVTHKDILVLFNDKGDCIIINNKDCTVCVVSPERIIDLF